MPYYSSVANNFTDLRTALFSVCTANGWSLSTDVLTKGTLAVKITINEVSVSAQGVGLILQGGVSATGATLNTPSVNKARLGPTTKTGNAVTWPVTYEIFIFDNPDEVYMLLNTNVDQYLWLAFGKSSVEGIGLWFDAVANLGEGQISSANGTNLNVSTGEGGGGGGIFSSCSIFATTNQSSAALASANKDSIHVDMDSIVWAGNPTSTNWTTSGAFNALKNSYNLLNLLPNAWNGEGVFVRIRPMMWRAGNKGSVIADLKNARYTRVDNYEPGQLVTLGTDNWKVYPFYRKNSAVRDGGINANHTGTFGWAIRYDGPV